VVFAHNSGNSPPEQAIRVRIGPGLRVRIVSIPEESASDGEKEFDDRVNNIIHSRKIPVQNPSGKIIGRSESGKKPEKFSKKIILNFFWYYLKGIRCADGMRRCSQSPMHYSRYFLIY
jgi:hypothetical protein